MPATSECVVRVWRARHVCDSVPARVVQGGQEDRAVLVAGGDFVAHKLVEQNALLKVAAGRPRAAVVFELCARHVRAGEVLRRHPLDRGRDEVRDGRAMATRSGL